MFNGHTLWEESENREQLNGNKEMENVNRENGNVMWNGNRKMK